MRHQCPACSANDTVPGATLEFKASRPLSIWQCSQCHHRWLHTSADAQHEIEAGYHADYEGFRIDPYFVATISKQLSTRLLHLGPAAATLLDVGCGNGEFLRQAARFGFRCEGIDVSEAAAEICRKNGLQATCGDFLSHQFGQAFDLVTMWDVMEHLRSPFDFAARAFSVLQPGGSLVLKIPSPGALNFHFLRLLPSRGGTLLSAPGHVQYFTEHSLSQLLSRAGFTEVIWLDSLGFRSRRRTWNPKRILSRQLTSLAGHLAKNTNLYAFATKGLVAPEVVSKLSPRRVQRLAVST
jgi:SAM-dependent methyltransferase